MLVGLLAGRAAEETVFDTVTTGASNDIEKATAIARAMVTQYGMSKKFGLIGLQTVESQYLEGRAVMNCSDVTAAEVDAEVMTILKECYEEALALLRDNREILDKIAAYLIEKETITGKEFMKIYRQEKGLPDPEEKPEDSQVQRVVELEQPEQSASVSEEQSQQETQSISVPEDEMHNQPEQPVSEQPEQRWNQPNTGQIPPQMPRRPTGPVGRFSNVPMSPEEKEDTK